jgi:hypothetical protein
VREGESRAPATRAGAGRARRHADPAVTRRRDAAGDRAATLLQRGVRILGGWGDVTLARPLAVPSPEHR